MQKQFYESFIRHLGFRPTVCQNNLFQQISEFIFSDENDIFVINGYAGTGKTSAIAAVVKTLFSYKKSFHLLAPTGRAAKVLASYTGFNAYTIHKHIYRQKSVREDGFGQFGLDINKSRNAIFVVDEASLIGIDGGGGSQSSNLFGSGNLLEDLVNYVRSGINCKLILLGDAAQLPPIGLDMSPVLSKDFMQLYGSLVYCELNTVVRQEKNSGILHNATILREMIAENYCDSLDLELHDTLSEDFEPFVDVQRIGGDELIEKLSEAYQEFGEEETIVLCRSNRRANLYNAGIRSRVLDKGEEKLVAGDKLMIVKNCYHFVEDVKQLDYIANGDIATIVRFNGRIEEKYGLHYADMLLAFPDYEDVKIEVKAIVDTLESESPSLTYEQQNALYLAVNDYYLHQKGIKNKAKRYTKVKEDDYFSALQIKYAYAITGHKSQGGQWKCVFIDNPFWKKEYNLDDLKWLYTALTRASVKVYLVNFKDENFA